ncbi:MAG TPA: signal peptidase I [Candidatus Brocadiia bacterium]|nr:signal peptidase I [Candidatus Brocadiales bacterium]
MSESNTKFITYTGPSMNPTLKAPDMLEVIPYDGNKIRCGDVVVFVPPGGNHKVIHRIISIDSQGIRTRGDHNANVDEWVLCPDDIVGRVIRTQRGDRWLRIYGGLMGRVYAFFLRTIRKINYYLISCPLHFPYRWLAKSGIFRGWLAERLKIHVLTFNRSYGKDMQLLMGRRVIGRYLRDKNKWMIRRPFRLVVDEASLPKGTTEQ